MSKQLHHAAALSLKQLSYLVAVADTLNFTKAAELCFVTQSTLSGGIAELERVLDVRLVERDRQRVALTEIGQQVVKRAHNILSESLDLVTLAHNATDPARGGLRLGVIPTIAPFVLTRLLKLTKQAFPELQVAIRESQTLMLLAEVESGELDAAVIALPMEVGKLHTHVLFEEALCLIAPKDDPLTRQGPQRLDTLHASERMLLLERGHCLRDHALLACSHQTSNNGAEANGVESTNLSTMVQLVNSGMGCALVPRMAIEAGILNNTEVAPVDLAEPLPKRTIALVSRPTHPKLDFLVGAFAQTLAQCRSA